MAFHLAQWFDVAACIILFLLTNNNHSNNIPYFVYSLVEEYLAGLLLSTPLPILSSLLLTKPFSLLRMIILLDRKHFQSIFQIATAKSLQLCPTLCDPIDGSPPGSSVPEILQARTLEWVAISFSNA